MFLLVARRGTYWRYVGGILKVVCDSVYYRADGLPNVVNLTYINRFGVRKTEVIVEQSAKLP